MSIAPAHLPMLLSALVLAALWGITLRACWQQVYHQAKDPLAPVAWTPVLLPALLLSAGLGSAMLLVLGSIDLAVPVTTHPWTLARAMFCVLVLHLAVMLAASHMPRDAGWRRKAATGLAMVFSAGSAATMLYLVRHLHLAPLPQVSSPASWGLGLMILSIAALSYRQVNNRWLGGAIPGALVWAMIAVMPQILSWPANVYYVGVKDATPIAWFSVPLALAAGVAMGALLLVTWMTRLRENLSRQPLPETAPTETEIAALVETSVQELLEDRRRRDALYDRVLRQSRIRFWALDLDKQEYRFRGERETQDAETLEDEVMPAADWFGKYLHPEELDLIHDDVPNQLAARGWFDCLHRKRVAEGVDDWRWVIARGTVVQRNGQGQPTYVVGTQVDVTEQRELQTALDRDGRLFSDGPIVMVRWVFDASSGQATELDFISPNIEKLWGYGLEDVYGFQTLAQVVEPGDLAGIGSKIQAAIRGGPPDLTHEFRVKLKDGRVLWHSLYARLETQDGHGYVNGFIVDIDSFKRVEQRSEEQARQLEELIIELRRAKDETAILRESSEFLNSAESLEEAFHIISRAASAIFPEWGGALASAQDQVRLRLAGRWGEADEFNTEFSSGDCWALRRGRAHHFVDERISLRCRHVHSPVGEQPRPYLCIPMSANGETVGSLHLMSRVMLTKEQMVPLAQRANRLGETLKLALSNLRLRAGLREQATHDGLTGLYNRRFMNERLPIEIKRCEREGHSVALAMIDVDHFKRINDQFGHEAGDTVLKALGELLRQRVRVYDLACRYGGEELVLIMPGCSMADAMEKLESIRLAVAAMNLSYNAVPLPTVTISVGLAETSGGDADHLLKQADERLYHAKRTGRNRLSIAVEEPPATPLQAEDSTAIGLN